MEYTVEADRKRSTHTGMVFGQYRSDADEQPLRIVGWFVLRDGRVISRFRLKKEAQAFIARQA